jgi:hypothetical protein
MICNNDQCSSIIEPEIKYAWFNELNFSSFHCYMHKLEIKGHQLKLPLFLNAKTSCLPKDRYCIVENNIYIWEEEIILKCPYLKIKDITLNVSETIAIGDNLFFQLEKKIEEFGMEIFPATEGIFLTKSNPTNKLCESEININQEQHIMLADIDKRSFAIISIMEKLAKTIQKQNCFNTLNIINIMSRNINKYLSFRDNSGKILILYNNNGEIIVKICVKIELIYIKEFKNLRCQIDIPV